MMRQVLYALAPAAGAWTFFFGPGLLVNALVATVAALLTEALALRLRGSDLRLYATDGSAVVTAVLLAFCLPPLTPWWVTAAAAAFGIGVAKHLYGGLGFNVFNPAMAGYAVVLVAFPGHLDGWLPPALGDLDYRAPGLGDVLHFTAFGTLPPGLDMDAVTRATPLAEVRGGLAQMRTLREITASPVFGDFGGRGWEWVGNFIALGGAWLLYRGVIHWQAPAAMLGALAVAALVPWLGDPETHASPLFHLYGGGALLGAFFVATDPVSSSTTDRGRLVYGAGIGLLTFAARAWGDHPDGVAFAVLAMNALVPLIDRVTRPRIHGH